MGESRPLPDNDRTMIQSNRDPAPGAL